MGIHLHIALDYYYQKIEETLNGQMYLCGNIQMNGMIEIIKDGLLDIYET